MKSRPATPEEALAETDRFYREQKGFGYDPAKVVAWLNKHVKIPKHGKVLDVCCGDGIWSRGFQLINPALALHGIDISAGGIDKARRLLGLGDEAFVVGDTEKPMPFAQRSFDLIFARGPGLFNQHDMCHADAVAVLELWHEYLTDDGRFYAIYASDPKLMGRYTPVDEVVLPYNWVPRDTGAVKFSGGKFHHTRESFEAPFRKARNVEIVSYDFGVGNLHILVSRRV